MKFDSFEEVKEITRKLVSISSIVGKPTQETACAKEICKYYASLEYFKKNSKQVYMIKTIDDIVERHSTIAYIKGTKNPTNNKTIILMGHIDTVDIGDFGPEPEIAFNSNKIIEYLRGLTNLNATLKTDIESGEYMFGRGSLDMKSGVACQMYVMKYFSIHPEELSGNIIAIAHCDEEDMSHGILSGLKEFEKLKEKENFEYIASINSDYCTPYYEGDENRYVYYGAVGKLLPSFYVVGRESHVGQPYGGLDPNLIVAEITKRMDLNVDLCDEALGETTMPPISLRQMDLKDVYTVQTSNTAYCYYNFFTHGMSPKDVIYRVKEIAVDAFDSVINNVNMSYEAYCNKTGFNYIPKQWETRVFTYEEFYNELAQTWGEKFKKHMESFSHNLNQNQPEMDLRVFSKCVIEEAWKWSEDKNPVIILYFSSSYCPRVEVTGKDTKEQNLIKAVEKAVEKEGSYCNNNIVTKYFFPYISDASFMAVCDDEESLYSLEKNMPAWGEKYTHKINDIRQLNVPVANIGSHGNDGHMYTERVHEKYTFNNVAHMIYNTVLELQE